MTLSLYTTYLLHYNLNAIILDYLKKANFTNDLPSIRRYISLFFAMVSGLPFFVVGVGVPCKYLALNHRFEVLSIVLELPNSLRLAFFSIVLMFRRLAILLLPIFALHLLVDYAERFGSLADWKKYLLYTAAISLLLALHVRNAYNLLLPWVSIMVKEDGFKLVGITRDIALSRRIPYLILVSVTMIGIFTICYLLLIQGLINHLTSWKVCFIVGLTAYFTWSAATQLSCYLSAQLAALELKTPAP